MLASCHHASPERWAQIYSDARLTLEQGDLPAALSKADRGFRDTADNDAVWNWKFRVLQGEILLWQHKSNEVLRVLATPPPVELSNGEFAVREKATEGLALAYLGSTEKAEVRFKEAEELAFRTAPKLRCQVALFEGNEAYFRGHSAGADNALRVKQYALAEQHYQLSLRLAPQCQQPNIEEGALIGLGIVLTACGRFDEAMDWSLKSIGFARANQFHLAEVNAEANLGWSYEQLGDLEKAVSSLSKAAAAFASLHQLRDEEFSINNLGDAYLAQGDYSASREAHLKALSVAKELESSHSSDEKSGIIFALTQAATAALEEGKVDEAQQYAVDAAAIDSTDPRTVLISARLMEVRRGFGEARSLLQKILKAKGAENLIVWDAEVEWARILAAEHRNNQAGAEFQKVIDQIETARSGVRVIENRLAFSSHSRHVYDDYIRFLVGTGQREKAFQVAEFGRARILAEGVGLQAPGRPSDIRIDRIQRFLRARKKIILAYWLTPEESFLWLVSPSHFEMFTLARGKDIEQKAADYNKAILDAQGLADLDRQGEALYELLVAPARKLIPQEARLVIIPQGGLTRLNFETLRVPGPTPHYWIQDAELETASSSNLLIQERHGALPVQRLLLIGDPIQASTDYPVLPHAGEEIRRLKAHFSSSQETAISREEATPAAFQSGHPERFDLIHFVTHGTASELSPLESAIVLSPEPDHAFKLYARDIVKTHLQAEVVTISACYGAGTRTYSGEGLVGLAWAFLRAGAHQVVAGLWEVDDRAAVDLMDDFYGELQKGKPASTALRLAKLKMAQSDTSYNRPYYWGSLQLYVGE